MDTAAMHAFCKAQAQAKGPGFFADMAWKGPTKWTPNMRAAIAKAMAKAAQPKAPPPAPVQVTDHGGMQAIASLFAKAGQTLKRPSVVLKAEGIGAIRISRAGADAKVPGSLNVADDAPFGKGAWYGRITQAGEFQPSAKHPTPRPVLVALALFAADPAGTAAAYGKTTGACCFCSRDLEDERSTSVGYGPICAKKWGLPWGEAPVKEAA